MVPLSKEQLLRSAFWAPCKTRAHLQSWIKTYLQLDLQDTTICDDDVTNEPSNSNPIDLIWEIYSSAMDGKNPHKTKFLAYASRNGSKTLSCAVIEVLAMFHLRRSVGHLATQEIQASRCATYVEKFLRLPILRDFLSSNNKRTIEISYHESPDRSTVLSPAEFKTLLAEKPSQAATLIKRSYSVQIVIGTISGVNGLHCPLLIVDEADLMAENVFREASMIPSMAEDGGLPITFITSTRKYAYGLVQREIDSAKETGLLIRHWNVIDISEPCPPERHLPNEPMIDIYFSEDSLRTGTVDDYHELTPKEQESWRVLKGYAGCLSNCSLFAVCKTRLATKQKSKSKMLQNLHLVTNQFKALAKDVERAKAQLMCYRPESSGMVFPHLSEKRHFLTAAQMYERITGDAPRGPVGKQDIFLAIKRMEGQIAAGMDYGFTHNFAVCLGGNVGVTLYMFHAFALSGLEINEKLDYCNTHLRPYGATIYPDQAYPSDIKSFRMAGYDMRKFDKDVQLGISAGRSKIMPTMGGDPEVFFLKDDPGCEALFKNLTQYHYKTDAQDNPTDQPEDVDDDLAAAWRYLCQNLYGKHLGKGHKPPDTKAPQDKLPNPNQNWMAQEISQQIQENNGGDSQGVVVKRGKFFAAT